MRTLSIFLLASLIWGSWSIIIEETILYPTIDSLESPKFGISVAISSDGTRALVGAPQEFAVGLPFGEVYVFDVNPGNQSNWTRQAIFRPPTDLGCCPFGKSLALSSDGTRALVGAYGISSLTSFTEAAYVYDVNPSNASDWTVQAILYPSIASGDPLFGQSLALSSNGARALVGAPGDDIEGTDAGAAYVFDVNPSNVSDWLLQTILYPSNGTGEPYFGTSVSISSDGTRVIIGADGDDIVFSGAGASYIFDVNPSNASDWIERVTLYPSIIDSFAYFGNSVALSSDGSRALIGAYGDDTVGSNVGATYVFDVNPSNASDWIERIILYPSIATGSPFFGVSVALSSDGSRALIGAYGDDTVGSNAGATYVFDVNANNASDWIERIILYPNNSGTGVPRFGSSVAISSDGSRALIGDPQDGTVRFEAGSTYVIDIGCPSGSILIGNGTACEPCPNGTISKFDTCVTCPAGQVPDDDQFTCIDCPGGEIPNANQSACEPCPSGTISNVSLCTNCPSGLIPNGDQSACVLCPGGQFFNAGQCDSCSPGLISNTDGTECEPCPSGTISNLTQCIDCPFGQVPNGDQSTCITCSVGEIPNDDQSACEPCQDGTIAVNATCRGCPAGQIPNADQSECQSCPDGEDPNGEGTKCVGEGRVSNVPLIAGLSVTFGLCCCILCCIVIIAVISIVVFVAGGVSIGGAGVQYGASRKGLSLVDGEELFTMRKVDQSSIILADQHFVIRYEDLKIENPPIGQGAFGVVNLGYYKGTRVAIKTLIANAAEDDCEEFLGEVDHLTKLHHPNVVLFIGACEVPRAIVTEFVARGSLFDIIHRDPGLLIWKRVRKILKSAAKGLAYLHSQEPPMIHRDVKSGNILISKNFEAKVCDFGISRREDVDTTMTMRAGTTRWTAPEILNGDGRYTTAADVYSYGIMVWEVVTREIPFDGEKFQFKIEDRVIAGERPELQPDEWPEEVCDFMTNCWANDAEDRPTFESIISMVKSLPSSWNEFDQKLPEPLPDKKG